MNWLQTIISALIAVFSAMLGGAITCVFWSFKFGGIWERFCSLEKTVSDKILSELREIKNNLHAIDKRTVAVETIFSNRIASKYAPQNSPRKLNDAGYDVLEKSGIKPMIETEMQKILEIIKQKNPTNPYDAERIVHETVSDFFSSNLDYLNKLKLNAFNNGFDLVVVFFVAGVYVRDLIFPKLGFDLAEFAIKK